MGLQYTTPTVYSAEIVTATSWYDECLWKEFSYPDDEDLWYRDDIDEISPDNP